MPEARDRLARPVDLAVVFARRRMVGTGVLIDEVDELFRSPLRQPATATPSVRTPAGFGATRGGGLRRGGFMTPRVGNRRGQNSIGALSAARYHTPARRLRGRGRGQNSVLPSWYPRTPLADITAVVRAIERRRARLRGDEGLEIESPIPEDQRGLDPSVPSLDAPLEHDNSITTPAPSAVRIKPCPPSVIKVHKILHEVANQNTAESECLTPQKKLLNSIDTVEKVVMEELKKLKRTPSAKKAERENRVRTLMSMR
ncbi:hypothetical protein UlMin_005221 [Ulmus minor]